MPNPLSPEKIGKIHVLPTGQEPQCERYRVVWRAWSEADRKWFAIRGDIKRLGEELGELLTRHQGAKRIDVEGTLAAWRDGAILPEETARPLAVRLARLTAINSFLGEQSLALNRQCNLAVADVLQARAGLCDLLFGLFQGAVIQTAGEAWNIQGLDEMELKPKSNYYSRVDALGAHLSQMARRLRGNPDIEYGGLPDHGFEGIFPGFDEAFKAGEKSTN